MLRGGRAQQLQQPLNKRQISSLSLEQNKLFFFGPGQRGMALPKDILSFLFLFKVLLGSLPEKYQIESGDGVKGLLLPLPGPSS